MSNNVKDLPPAPGAKELDEKDTITRVVNLGLPEVIGKGCKDEKDKKDDKEPLKRINFNLTESEHAALKMACIREKTSISDVMSALVREWLAKHAEK